MPPSKASQTDTAALLERDHLEGCPEIDNPTGRVERYTARKPPTDESKARDVTVTRCTTCGGQRVDDT